MIQFINKPFRLKILSPIHIGSGNLLTKNTDFFIEEDKIFKIAPKTIFKILGKEKLDWWLKSIENNQSILPTLKKHSEFNLNNDSYEIINSCDNLKNEIFEFIRNQFSQNPIIPGSSIKGSLRTALLYKKLKDEKIVLNNKTEFDNLRFVEKKYASNALDYKVNFDIFKYIQISDIEVERSNLSITKFLLLNERNSRIIKDFNKSSTVEVLEGDYELNGSIRINSKFWDNKLSIRSFDELVQSVNNFTKIRLEKLLESTQFDLDDGFLDQLIGDDIITFITALYNEFSNNSIILRVGKGSGWDFMTGAWLKDNVESDNYWDTAKKFLRKKGYEDFPFPKTNIICERKNRSILPGFVKLTFHE